MIYNSYYDGSVSGWLGLDNPQLVEESLAEAIAGGLVLADFKMIGQTRATSGRKMMLYDVVRKVLGRDTDNYPQEIGDCVSFGGKNAAEYLSCVQLLNGADGKFEPVFAPYYYGTSRNYIGQNRIGRGDGSVGSWLASAVVKYGTLFSSDKDVPPYSGSVAKRWGDSNSRDDLDRFVQLGQNRLIKSATLIKSWDELVSAIVNGYPCTIACDILFSMQPDRNGFHRKEQRGGHQTCFIGVDETWDEPYAVIINSWGDVLGHLKDFQTGEDLPVGVWRIKKQDAIDMINQQDCFAYSQAEWLVEQDLDKSLFKLI